MSGKASAGAGVTMDGQDEILSVEETVWSLHLGARNPPCNVARFDEVWVGEGSNKRKVTRPPFDDPDAFHRPAYMYRVQEAEEHSEDEDYEGQGKTDSFERQPFKRRVIKTRSIQWALEDRRDHVKGGGMKYLGDKTVQTSKYATFKVDDQRAKAIEVTPIDQWWHFKKAQKDDGKMMSVKEAEELMKKQENFMGPLSLANKVLTKKTQEAAERENAANSRFGHLDREDTQVLQEAGLQLGAAEDLPGRAGGQNDSGSEGPLEPEKGEVDSDAGGEDDDFGDEIRSDDEEEVGNDDANEGGGTLHQDDEDWNDSEGDFTDDEHHELQKLSRTVNADGEEEDDYTVGGEGGRSTPVSSANGNPAAPVDLDDVSGAGTNGAGEPGVAAGAKRGASALADDGGATGGAGSGGEGAGSSKRQRRAQKKGSQEINQTNVVATLKRYGGRLASKLVLRHFVAALKVDGKANKTALNHLKEILKKVANKVDDAIDGTVWILKDHFS